MRGAERRRHTSHPHPIPHPHVKCALSFLRFGGPFGSSLCRHHPWETKDHFPQGRYLDTLPSVCLKFWIKCGGVQETRLLRGGDVSSSRMDDVGRQGKLEILDQQRISIWGVRVSTLEAEPLSSRDARLSATLPPHLPQGGCPESGLPEEGRARILPGAIPSPYTPSHDRYQL